MKADISRRKSAFIAFQAPVADWCPQSSVEDLYRHCSSVVVNDSGTVAVNNSASGKKE